MAERSHVITYHISKVKISVCNLTAAEDAKLCSHQNVQAPRKNDQDFEMKAHDKRSNITVKFAVGMPEFVVILPLLSFEISIHLFKQAEVTYTERIQRHWLCNLGKIRCARERKMNDRTCHLATNVKWAKGCAIWPHRNGNRTALVVISRGGTVPLAKCALR